MFHVYNVPKPPTTSTSKMDTSNLRTQSTSKLVSDAAAQVLTTVDLQILKLGPEEDYDPHKHRDVPKPTSSGDTMTHTVKALCGVGLLALPNAMSRMGLVFGTFGMFFLGFMATYCIQILIIAEYKVCKKKKVGYLSYPEAIRIAVKEGPPNMRWSANFLAKSVDAFLLIWQIGVCVVFLVFVAENLKQFILYCGQDTTVRIIIACLYPFLACLCMIKDLKLLSPLSTFSNACNIFGLILVFYYLTYDDLKTDDSKYKLQSLMDIPIFIGMTLYAMEAVGVILALEYNMENPKDFTGWCGVFSKSMIIIVVMYAGLAIFGYLKYGMECKASITLNLPQHEKKAQAAVLAFAATILTSFPLQNFVAWQILWSYLESSVTNKRMTDLFLRIACASVPFILALLAPTLGPFIGLIGSLCLSTLGVLFPAIIDISVFYPDQYGVGSYKLFTDIFIMLFAIVCCFSGVYTSILEMIQTLS